MAQSLVTPSISHDSGVTVPSYDKNGTLIPGDSTNTIQLKIVSEFLEYPHAVAALGQQSKIVVVQDAAQQPVIIALSELKRLKVFFHVEGGPAAWQTQDITPDGASSSAINTFDAIQAFDSKVYLGVSLKHPDGICDVSHAEWVLPQVKWDETKSVMLNFVAPQWRQARNNLGGLAINTLNVSQTTKTVQGNDVSAYYLTAGTQETASKTALHYVLNTSTAAEIEPWTAFTLAGTAQKITALCPGSLLPGPGCFTLFQRPGDFTDANNGDLDCRFDTLDGGVHYRISLAGIGKPQSLWSNSNVAGQTDLFIASSAGLGFYNFQTPDHDPQVLHQDISFKDITSSETLVDDKISRIVIFALSSHDQLFYIEATRDLMNGAVSFNSSGIPIRLNVQQMSAQYNAKSNAAELVYLSNSRDEVFHLWKDGSSNLWQEQQIKIKTDGKMTKTPSYVTTLALISSTGERVPGYPCNFTSEYAFVVANSRSHILDTQPTEILTDDSGKIIIQWDASNSLTPPQYKLALNDAYDAQRTFSTPIIAAQRVLRGLAGIKSADSISNAVNTKGDKVFPDAEAKRDDIELAGGVGQHFETFIRTVDPSTANDNIGKGAPSTDVTVSWEKDANGIIKQLGHSWLDDAFETVKGWIGDALEFIRGAFKAAVKVALKIVGPVVKFFFKIAGKAMVFILKSIGPVVRSIATFLGDVLGIDVSGFLNWFGFVFDLENTKKTQAVLVNMTKNTFTSCRIFMDSNRQLLHSVMGELRASVATVIKDYRPPPGDFMDGKPVSGPLDFILNNPIMSTIYRYTPMSVIGEALAEEFGKDLFMPDMSALNDIITRVIPKLADDEVNIFIRLIEDVIEKFKAVLTGEKSGTDALMEMVNDVIWTLFDATEAVVFAVIDIIIDLVETVLSLIEGAWGIPIVTDVWKDFVDQDLSVLNVVTLIAAQALNLYSGTVNGKLFFEEHPVPQDFMRYSADDMDLGRLFAKVGFGTEKAHFDSRPKDRPAEGEVSTMSFTSFAMTEEKPLLMAAAASAETPPAPTAKDDKAEKAFEEYKKIDVSFDIISRTFSMLTIVVDNIFVSSKGVGSAQEGNQRGPYGPTRTKVRSYGHSWTNKFDGKMGMSDVAWGQCEKAASIIGTGVQMICGMSSLIALVVHAVRDNALKANRIAKSEGNAAGVVAVKVVGFVLKFAAVIIRFRGPEKYKDIVSNFLNLISGWVVVIGQNMAIDYHNQSAEERAKNESKCTLAAGVLELTGGLFAATSTVCGQLVSEGQVEAAVVMFPCNAADLALTTSGIGLVIGAYANPN